jgi:hypothetical protein
VNDLYFRCPNTGANEPIRIGIDAQSLQRVAQSAIVLQCSCGELHRIAGSELFRLPPNLPAWPYPSDPMSKISA